MRVILYQPEFGQRGNCAWQAHKALREGLTKLGVAHEVARVREWKGEIADVAIIHGWTKALLDRFAYTTRNDVIAAQGAAGKPAWCLDRGFVGDREEWSAISIGGFSATGGDFRAEGMPGDRIARLGAELSPWRGEGEHVLLAAQVTWDAQVDAVDYLDWLPEAIGKIRRHTDRPIVFRGHPKAWRKPNPYARVAAALDGVRHDPLDAPPRTTPEEDMAGAHAVVCFNSTMATVATMNGVPAFTAAASTADPIASRDWSTIDHPPHPDRTQWLRDLSYKQWNLDDFREGRPWQHLTR